MSNTIITARVTGEELHLVNVPLIASGSKGFLQVQCEFDATWAGYGKTAVFYRTEEDVYHVALVEGKATIPHEVLTEDGHFFFGIFGAAENVRTTEVLRLTIKQGALTTATAESEAPTLCIYQQLLAAYGKAEDAIAVERARIDQLVALRGGGEGVEEFQIRGDYFNGALYTNGAAAFISVEFFDLPLGGNTERTDMCLPPQYAPLSLVTFKSLPNSPTATISIQPRAWSGTEWAGITITNSSAEAITDAVEFEGYYDLEALSIPELSDIRVGFDGTAYLTAGEAVREIGRTAAAAGLVLDVEGADAITLHASAGLPFRSFQLDATGLTTGEWVGIELSGRNLFDISMVGCKAEYPPASIPSTCSITVTGNKVVMGAGAYQADIFLGTAGVEHPVDPRDLHKLLRLPAGTYTLSYEISTSTLRPWLINDDGTVNTTEYPSTKYLPGTFTLEKPGYITLRRGGTAVVTVTNIQLEKSGTAHPWEPYRAPQQFRVTAADNGNGEGFAGLTDILAQHPYLRTFKPTTIVRTTDNGDGLMLRAEYYGNAKTYIDHKFTELQAAILSTGANI